MRRVVAFSVIGAMKVLGIRWSSGVHQRGATTFHTFLRSLQSWPGMTTFFDVYEDRGTEWHAEEPGGAVW